MLEYILYSQLREKTDTATIDVIVCILLLPSIIILFDTVNYKGLEILTIHMYSRNLDPFEALL